jgi:PAS domain S-box-containing protein
LSSPVIGVVHPATRTAAAIARLAVESGRTNGTDIDAAADRLIDLAMDVLVADRASIWTVDPLRDGAGERYPAPIDGGGTVIPRRMLESWAADPDRARRVGDASSSILDVPLRVDGECTGLLRIERSGGRDWTEDDHGAANAIALHASLLLERSARVRVERRLRERERQLADMQAIAGIGIWEWDVTDNRITWSEEQLRLHGLDRSTNPEDFGTFVAIVHPDDRDTVVRECENLIRTGRPFAFPYRIVRSDGVLRWMMAHGQLTTDEETGHVRMIGTSHDITERREAERALRRSEESYRTIFELAGDALFVHDPETGAILDANRKACELHGVSLDALKRAGVGGISSGLGPFTEGRAQELVRLAAAGDTQRFEWMGRSGTGDPVWVEVSLQGVQMLGERRVVAVVRVISERKLAEESIRRAYAEMELRVAERTNELAAANAALGSEIEEHRAAREQLHRRTAELEAVFRALPDLYFRLQPDGTVLDHRYGSDDAQYRPQPEGFPADLVGTNAFDYVPPHVADKLKWALEEVLRTGRLVRIEYPLVVGGARHDYESRLMPLEDGTAVSVVRDVSEQKRTESALAQAKEAAERANRAKSEFLSRMSHELRTPMNSILGFAQVLARAELPGSNAKSVQHILRAGRHLLQLINEVLDISRIEAGRHNLSIEPVRVSTVLQEVVGIVRPLAAEHDVEIEDPLLAVSRDWFVNADRQRISQVMLNLLSNAIKYNRRGGRVRMDCAVERTDATSSVVIRVSDTGPGIPGDRLNDIFTPFARLGAEQTEVEGTGLGLALSHRLVEAMGGELTLDRTGPNGSTFTLRLAAASSPLAMMEESGAAPDRSTEAPHGPATLLYIEDNLANLTLVETVLQARPKWRTIPALQGRLGIELALQHSPDLILLDIHLPDIPGDEVLRRLNADERTSKIPVVVISADATQSAAERLLASGVAAFLTKPLDIDEFVTTIERLLPDRTAGR